MTDSFNSPVPSESAISNDPPGLEDDLFKEVLVKNRFRKLDRKKKILLTLTAVVVLAAAGMGLHKFLGTDDRAEFLTTAVAKASIMDTIEATGTLEPVKMSQMGFKNDSTIIALNVQPGDQVSTGQVLAQQDPATLKAALEQARSSLLQNEISLQSLTMNYESNQKTLSQQEQLFEAGLIAQSELDLASNNLRKSELELASAEAKLVNDQAKIEQAQSDLDGATLIAPFDGIIGAVNGQVGQINGINSSSSTLLTVMSQELQLSALVNEADIGRIKVGQKVEFTSNAYPNQVFHGQVVRVTPEAQSVSNVQYYPVLISCEDPDNQLYSGMSVSATIIVVREDDVLTVPMMAASFAQNYLRQNPQVRDDLAAPSPDSANGIKPNSDNEPDAGTQPANNGKPRSLPTDSGAEPQIVREKASGDNDEGSRGMVVVLENGTPVVKTVRLGMSNGSVYKVISGLNEGEEVIIGSTTVNNNLSSGSSSGNPGSSPNVRARGGGGMTVVRPGF